jgi:hypothetical protein
MRLKDKANLPMNAETYALRRKVIEIIYRASALLTTRLPRVEVRITEPTNWRKGESWVGRAIMGDNKIWIPSNTLDMGESWVNEVVYHELIHAIFGVGHNEDCPLMSSNVKGISIADAEKLFVEYAEKFGYKGVA